MKIAVSRCHNKRHQGASNERYGITEYQVGEHITHSLASLLVDDGHHVEYFEGRLKDKDGVPGKVTQINNGHFDVAVETHLNADTDHLDPHDLDDTRGQGSMVMFYPKAMTYTIPEPMSERQQEAALINSMISTFMGQRNLGARPGWYWGDLEDGIPKFKDYFLKATNCASFIFEPGYIDNNKFAKHWLLDGGCDKLAQAIHFGLSMYLK